MLQLFSLASPFVVSFMRNDPLCKGQKHRTHTVSTWPWLCDMYLAYFHYFAKCSGKCFEIGWFDSYLPCSKKVKLRQRFGSSTFYSAVSTTDCKKAPVEWVAASRSSSDTFPDHFPLYQAPPWAILLSEFPGWVFCHLLLSE